MTTGAQAMRDNPELTYAYTREDAINDGEQVLLEAAVTKEAGFKIPVYMTRAAWAATVEAGGKWEPAEGGDGEMLKLPLGQDVQGRLWDVLSVMMWKAKMAGGVDRITFKVSVYAYDGKAHRHDVELLAVCAAVDIDDPAPCITVMLPDED